MRIEQWSLRELLKHKSKIYIKYLKIYRHSHELKHSQIITALEYC